MGRGCLSLVPILLLLGLSTLSSAKMLPQQPGSASAAAEAALRRAILAANNGGGVGYNVTFTLTTDIILSRPLPLLGFNAGIYVKGACPGRRCSIDGRGVLPLFNGTFDCFIMLSNLVIQNMNDSVHRGACSITARHVTFQSNKGPAGPVLNNYAYWPVEGSPHQFTACEFINNTAMTGSGGVFYLGSGSSGGAQLSISNSVFRGNKALKGAGGAIYSEGGSFYIFNVDFDQNSAVNGGAAYLYSGALRLINTRFTANSATSGPGGALYGLLDAEFGQQYSFCNSSFSSNVANPKHRQSSNAFFTSYSTDQEIDVHFCPRRLFYGVHATTNITLKANCSGCSGCDGDCYGNGKCVLDAVDSNPSCKCTNHYDTSTSCTACQTGYTLASGCTKCLGGFYGPLNQPGSCTTCPGLDKIDLLMGMDRSINGAVPASKPKQCQQLCKATQKCEYSSSPECKGVMYCNMWAYIWPRKLTPAACSGMCVMYYNQNDCGVQPVYSNATLGITYQLDEKSNLNCD